CHAANDPEGQFVLESFETLMKGGEIGPPIVPGKSADSLLVQMIEGRFEKEGKKKIMPQGKRPKLTAQEIATIKAWIDTGAHAHALVLSSDGAHLFAAGGQPGLRGEVREWSVAESTPVRTLEGHKDAIYSVALSPDGTILATGSYDQKIKLWNLETGKELKTL